MSTKIYVGNLPWRATDEQLAEMFGAHGEVIEARIINDRETGRSRGFGFVTMAAADAAQNAIRAFNGFSMQGRALVVNEAREPSAVRAARATDSTPEPGKPAGRCFRWLTAMPWCPEDTRYD